MYNKNFVFIAACIGMLVFGVSMLSLGAILPHITSKFGLSGYSAGALVSVLPFGILSGSLFFGPIVDRYGYKFILIISAFSVILSLFGLILSYSLFLLYASILILGFSGGVINGSSNALVADISANEKGAKLSLLGVFYGVGALGMPVLLGSLSGIFTTETILISVTVFLSVLVFFLVVIDFPSPKNTQGFPIKEGIKLITNPVLLICGLFLAFQSGIEGIGNNWTTTFLQKHISSSEENSLFALTYLVLALTITRLVLSFILGKLGEMYVLYMSLIIVCLGAVIIFLGNSYFYTVIGLVFWGIGFAAGFPIMLGFVAELFAKLSGTAFSLIFVIALSGNMFLNYITGVVSEIYGIKYYTIIVLLSAIFMITLLTKIKSKILHK